VFCAVSGVEPQSETVWIQANRYNVPRIVFVNKMDRQGADFENVLHMIHKRLGARAVAIQIPHGREAHFRGIVDLITMKATEWNEEDMGSTFEEIDIPDELREKAEKYREKLIENLCDFDDELMEQYLSGKELEASKLKAVLRKAIIKGEIFPVLCGSAFKNKGVQKLLDAVVDFLPSPVDLPPVEGVDLKTGETALRKVGPDQPFSALNFKIMTDPYVGKLISHRIARATLRSGRTSTGT